MTYKVNFNGGTLEETLESFDRQVQQSQQDKNMGDNDAEGMRRLLNALPKGNISGFIQNNNNGTTTIQVTVREQAPAEVTKVRSTATSRSTPESSGGNLGRPMESQRANEGASTGRAGATTAAGGPVVQQGSNATGGAGDAKAQSQAKAAEAKPGNTQ